jgi:hypothetical protein
VCVCDAPFERRSIQKAARFRTWWIRFRVAVRHDFRLTLGRVAASVHHIRRVDCRQRRHERRVAQIQRCARGTSRALHARVRTRDAAAAFGVVVGLVRCRDSDHIPR